MLLAAGGASCCCKGQSSQVCALGCIERIERIRAHCGCFQLWWGESPIPRSPPSPGVPSIQGGFQRAAPLAAGPRRSQPNRPATRRTVPGLAPPSRPTHPTITSTTEHEDDEDDAGAEYMKGKGQAGRGGHAGRGTTCNCLAGQGLSILEPFCAARQP